MVTIALFVPMVTMASNPIHATREQWLNAFMVAARPQFALAGAPLPLNVRISVGFPSSGRKGKSIGECWSAIASDDGHFEIFLKPTLDSDARIADVLTHELVHAAVGLEARHGKAFGKVAKALGLGGKMTATIALEGWYAWALPILNELGPMPYAVLNSGLSSAKPKQKTNLLKVECDCCGWLARVTAKWIEPYSYLQCPDNSCNGQLIVG